MENWRLILFIIYALVSPVRCTPRRRNNDNTQTFHRTGEAVALDSSIQKYEKDHRIFYEAEIKNGKQFKWPAVYNKNLSHYCRKYLGHIVPTRRIVNVTGAEIRKSLNYKKENAGTITDVIVVQCKIIYSYHSMIYYMTRALEPNCVYALKCSGNRNKFICNIINKYCDFEEYVLISNSLKRKKEETFGTTHCPTSQPIAKDEYLLGYELEHQELLKREGEEGKLIEWPHAMQHPNLDSFCYQYMSECAPSRNREGVIGVWKIQKLHYQILNANEDILVTVVSCAPLGGAKRKYYMTRAFESNCVYALLRLGFSAQSPLIIIFKHCDFEDLNNQQTIPQDYDKLIAENLIPKHKIKEGNVNTLGTL